MARILWKVEGGPPVSQAIEKLLRLKRIEGIVSVRATRYKISQ